MASPSIPKVSVKDFAREHKRFAVRASGSCLEPHLYDGDVLVIETRLKPVPGCVVAVELHGHECLKVYDELEDGHVVLRMTNNSPEYHDILVKPTTGLVIVGVAQELIDAERVTGRDFRQALDITDLRVSYSLMAGYFPETAWRDVS